MHPRIRQLVDYLDTQRAALLAAAAACPAERWAERPGPDRWSMSELCEHLHLVEHACARVIAKRAVEARDAGHPAEAETAPVLDALDAFGLTVRTPPRQAPERVVPTGGWSRERARAALESSRAELRAGIAAGDGLALGTVKHTHARLGEIDLYQWILFIGQHEARHAAQAREIASELAARQSSTSESVT